MTQIVESDMPQPLVNSNSSEMGDNVEKSSKPLEKEVKKDTEEVNEENASPNAKLAKRVRRKSMGKINRFDISASLKSPKRKVDEYVGGNGTKFADIPNFVYMLNKCTGKHQLPIALHRLLYGRDGKQTKRRSNLRDFSGFSFAKGTPQWEKVEAKLMKPSPWSTLCLRDLCRLLDIDRQGSKQEMVERVLEFLLNPKISDGPNHEDVYQEKLEKEVASRSKKEIRNRKRKLKKEKDAKRRKRQKSNLPKRPLSSYIVFANSVREKVKSENPEMKMTEISKVIGGMWRDLSASEKAAFKTDVLVEDKMEDDETEDENDENDDENDKNDENDDGTDDNDDENDENDDDDDESDEADENDDENGENKNEDENGDESENDEK